MMLKLSNIKTAFSELIDGIKDVKGLFFAVNEKNASVRMSKLRSGIYVGVVYPTIETQGGNDNGVQVHRLTVLILERSGGQADTDELEFERYQRTQLVTEDVLTAIGDANSLGPGVFSRLKIGETLIEPIYNLNGFDGWGMDLYI